MPRVLLCMLEAMEGELCLLEVLNVLEAMEVMRRCSVCWRCLTCGSSSGRKINSTRLRSTSYHLNHL